MILISLPDNKLVHPHLTLGKEYLYTPWGLNGVVITADNEEQIIILASRLEYPLNIEAYPVDLYAQIEDNGAIPRE